MEQRDFKGVWIPKQIWLDKELTWMEKLVLVELESLDNENGCFASNKYLAEFFQVSKPRITQIIKSLEKKGRLKVHLQKEGKRVIKRTIRVVNMFTRGGKYSKEGGKNTKQGVVNILKDNNTTVNNTINKECVNTQNTPPIEKEKEIDKPTQDDPVITITDKNKSDKENLRGDSLKTKRSKFIPPTETDAANYAEERIREKYPDLQNASQHAESTAEDFVNFYGCKNWMVGRTKMKNWKFALNRWIKKNYEEGKYNPRPNASNYDNANNQQKRYGIAPESVIRELITEFSQ